MNSCINDYTENSIEIQRLLTLLPATRQWSTIDSKSLQMNILPALQHPSNELINSRKKKNSGVLEIDFERWRSLTIDQRNLLFWHAVARLQKPGNCSVLPKVLVIKLGIVVLLLELLSQNLPGLAISLSAIGLAGYQLYQYYLGECSLRSATAADQAAIQLAIQFSYSKSGASHSLHSALKTLVHQTAQTTYRKQYQVRLRVLEILHPDTNFFESSVAVF